jgi:hypothetical protein
MTPVIGIRTSVWRSAPTLSNRSEKRSHSATAIRATGIPGGMRDVAHITARSGDTCQHHLCPRLRVGISTMTLRYKACEPYATADGALRDRYCDARLSRAPITAVARIHAALTRLARVVGDYGWDHPAKLVAALTRRAATSKACVRVDNVDWSDRL